MRTAIGHVRPAGGAGCGKVAEMIREAYTRSGNFECPAYADGLDRPDFSSKGLRPSFIYELLTGRAGFRLNLRLAPPAVEQLSLSLWVKVRDDAAGTTSSLPATTSCRTIIISLLQLLLPSGNAADGGTPRGQQSREEGFT